MKGEASYQKALAKVAGRLRPDGPDEQHRLVIAELSREPENRYDPNAIRVSVERQTVGYIPKERTGGYHAFLDWASSLGRSVTSRAHLVGGFVFDDGQRAHLGIYLDHSWPPVVQYDGRLPTLSNPDPRGGGSWSQVSVTGEEQCQDLLAGCLHQMQVARLQPVEGLVEVFIGDTSVGSLTKKMSERYAFGIAKQAEADQQPVTVFCRVEVGKNKLEATVALPGGEALAEWEMSFR